MSCTPNLRTIGTKISFSRGLVRTSASWCAESTCLVVIDPSWVLSLVKWQSISICLVLSWKLDWLQYVRQPYYHNTIKLILDAKFPNPSIDAEPCQFTISSCHCTVFCFSWGEWDCFLSLWSPRYQWWSKKNTITHCGSPSKWASCPIWVTISPQPEVTIWRKE
jgi:hypothetical protein